MTATPYVSFVTYGRNDAYTPSYVRRVNRAMACLARQLESAGIDGEIIIADWNPPAGRPHLIDILDVPSRLRHVSIRGIVVEPEHHLAFAGAAERAIHAGEAANVGLRRARGRFVTPKASDTFFSPQAIAMLARRDLDEGTMYRIDRHDIVAEDEAIWQLDDDALLAKLQCMPSRPHAWIRQSEHWGLRNLHTNACGDFTLMALRHWHRLRGHPHDDTVLTLDINSLVMHAAAALGVRECRWPDDCRIYKPSHENLSNARISQVWSWLAAYARQAPVRTGWTRSRAARAHHVRLSAAQDARCPIGGRPLDRAQLRGLRQPLGTGRKAVGMAAGELGAGRRDARRTSDLSGRLGNRHDNDCETVAHNGGRASCARVKAPVSCPEKPDPTASGTWPSPLGQVRFPGALPELGWPCSPPAAAPPLATARPEK